MSDKENLKSGEHKKPNPVGRRNFLKKAAIGAPIVLASSSRPAWGMPDCLSGIMSGNLSNHEHTCKLSGGLSHGHWKNHYVTGNEQSSRRGGSSVPDSSKKDHYFIKYGQSYTYSNSSHKTETVFDGSTYQTLLESGTRYQREIVTALLNADTGANSYPYSVSDILEIHSLVIAGDITETEASDLLEGLHSPNS